MLSRKLLSMALATSLSTIYIPWSQACEEGAMSDFDHIVTILKDDNGNAADTEYYNFSTNNCEKVKMQNTDAAVSSFIPRDETSLGLYSLYREKGESPVASLKHVYQFIAENS